MYTVQVLLLSLSLTAVQVVQYVIERAQSHEHTDGVDLRRCDDSQQRQDIVTIEHSAMHQTCTCIYMYM